MNRIFGKGAQYDAAPTVLSFLVPPASDGLCHYASINRTRFDLKAPSNANPEMICLAVFLAYGHRKSTDGLVRKIVGGKFEATIHEAFQSIEQMKLLTAGWDGYEAEVPSPMAREIARCFLDKLNIAGIAPMPRVSASVVGGIGFSFRRGAQRVYVEVRNCGTTHAIFSDDDSDAEPSVFPVRTDDTGLRVIAESIQEQFHVSAAVPC